MDLDITHSGNVITMSLENWENIKYYIEDAIKASNTHFDTI
jgi:hypothetical protein